MDFANSRLLREHGEPISASKHIQPIAEDYSSDSEYAPSSNSPPSRDGGYDFRSPLARDHKETPTTPSKESQNLFHYLTVSNYDDAPKPHITNNNAFEDSQNNFHHPIANKSYIIPIASVLNDTFANGPDGAPYPIRRQYLNTNIMPEPQGVFCCEMDEITVHDVEDKTLEDFMEWDKEERHRAGWIEVFPPEIMYPVDQLITIVDHQYANPGGKKTFRYFVRSSSGTNRWMEVPLKWYEERKYRYGHPCACVTHNCLEHNAYFTVLLREGIESPGPGARDWPLAE